MVTFRLLVVVSPVTVAVPSKRLLPNTSRRLAVGSMPRPRLPLMRVAPVKSMSVAGVKLRIPTRAPSSKSWLSPSLLDGLSGGSHGPASLTAVDVPDG